MRVAFDFNTVIKNRFSGFNTFGTNLLKAFDRLDADLELLLFYHRQNAAAAEEFRAELVSGRIKFCPVRLKSNHLKTLWNYCPLPKLEHLIGDFDVFHSFHNLMPPTRNKPRILTVHDLRRYRLAELYRKPESKIFRQAIIKADQLVAVSAATRDDICDIFQTAANKVSVARLACDEQLRPVTATEKAQLTGRLFEQLKLPVSPYLVTVSSSDHRKNILRTILAFQRVKSALPSGIKLIVAGFPPKNAEETAGIQAALDHDPDVIMFGAVDDLNGLVACSDGLVYASLYEGFGIPILEAFAFDIPVLTSNCSSMPEVGGEAAFYCHPEDVDSIGAGMLALFGQERMAKIAAGRERRHQFSWEKCAKDYLEVYHDVVKRHRH